MMRKKGSKVIVTGILLLLLFAAFFAVVLILQSLDKSEVPVLGEQFSITRKTRWFSGFIFGEVDKTMFPVINNPKYLTVDEANPILEDQDIVYFFETNRKTYVYPATILSYHHLVNDTINSEPIVMSLCLLSASAASYQRRVGNEVLEFGVTGTLFNGNLLMYDKTTDSQWLQLNGEAVEGSYAYSRLKTYAPVFKTTWKVVKEKENIAVLPPVRDMKFYREFYGSFLKSPFGIESLGDRRPSPLFDPFAIGVGIEVQDESAFYRLEQVKKKRIIQDKVGNFPLLIVYDPALNSSLIYLRTIESQTLDFVKEGEYFIDTQTSTRWNSKGHAVKGKMEGKSLQMPIFTEAYWFSWSTFYPQTKSL